LTLLPRKASSFRLAADVECHFCHIHKVLFTARALEKHQRKQLSKEQFCNYDRIRYYLDSSLQLLISSLKSLEPACTCRLHTSHTQEAEFPAAGISCSASEPSSSEDRGRATGLGLAKGLCRKDRLNRSSNLKQLEEGYSLRRVLLPSSKEEKGSFMISKIVHPFICN